MSPRITSSPALQSAKVVLTVLGAAVFGISLGLAIVAAFATQFLDYHVLSVASASMSPGIKKGDIVVTRPASADKVSDGDILYFSTSGGLPEVHRVAGIQKLVVVNHDLSGKEIGQSTDYRFVTKGDANEVADAGYTTPDRIHGRVWFHIPTYGLIGTGNSVTAILLGVAALMAVLWGAWEISRIVRSRRAPHVVTAPDEETPLAVGQESQVSP